MDKLPRGKQAAKPVAPTQRFIGPEHSPRPSVMIGNGASDSDDNGVRRR
jgi:hypothetical protein